MQEAERERIYWAITALLAVISPFTLRHMAEVESLSFHQHQLLAVLVSTLPIVLLVELGLTLLAGRPLHGRFWVREPSVESSHEVNTPPDEALARVQARLAGLAFTLEQTTTTSAVLSKPKRPKVNAFADHAFRGRLDLAPSPFGTRVTIHLTLQDTLLFATGEEDSLARLAAYLTLARDAWVVPSVSPVVYCGLAAAFVCAGCVAAVPRAPLGLSSWVGASSLAGSGMLLYALYFTLRDKQHLFGLRLLVGGLFLTLSPVVVVLWGLRGLL
jgi:hypothetical protein